MKKIFLVLFILCLGLGLNAQTVLYGTDFVANPTGATQTSTKGDFKTDAVTWASGYSGYFLTSGSAGTITYTFNPAIDLTGYTNCQLKVYWGSVSNRPMIVSINDGTAIEIDKISATADRSKVRKATTDLSGKITSVKFSSSGGGNVYMFRLEIVGESSGPSTDATLSELKINGNKLTGFSKDHTSYTVVGCWTNEFPTVSATATDSKAKVEITPANATSRAATVEVTAEDGKTTKTYTVSFQNDTNTPVVSSFTLEGYAGTISGENVSITVSADFDLTKAYEPVVKGQHVYDTEGAKVFSEGANTYSISSCGPTKTLTITIIRNTTPASTEAALSSLTVSAGTLNPSFSETVYDYVDSLEYNATTVPTVSVTTKDSKAKVEITQATSVTGKATIVVTAEDGKTTKTYTVQMALKQAPPTPPGPDPKEGVHCPGIYIWDTMDGGYGAKFVNYDGKDYEVFYVNRDEDGKLLGISTTHVDRSGIPVASGTATDFQSSDGWLVGKTTARSGDKLETPKEEFQGFYNSAQLQKGQSIDLKVQGYTSLAILGKDKKQDTSSDKRKPDDNQYFEVYIDGELQKQQFNKDEYTIRRYPMTTDQHTIRIVGIGAQASRFAAFSLQVGTSPVLPAPKIELLSGKTTGQVIYQTQQIERIRYTVKYNRSTSLHWVGTEATGIGLTTFKGEKYDTVMISGTANCPVGIYKYYIVANDGVKGVDSLEGSFEVKSKIWATTDTIVNTWAGQNIKQIKFRYYTLSADDITLSWTGGNAPSGITGSIIDGVYVIGGKSNDVGTFTFTISVKGGNNVHGSITLKNFNPGSNPILYLYKGDYQDGTYNYLKSIGKNPVEMEQNETLRDLNDYRLYTMIIISETCDADNKEVLAIARGEAKKPVLNMKSFSYSPGRLDWGVPDNGSIKNRSITVYREDHPIFRKMGKKRGDEITMLDTIITRGLMPAEVTYEGTACLATAWTRGREYNTDGKQETFLHEVPADMNGGQKYLCLPIASSSSERLSTDGKLLINNCIDYLLSTESGVTLPELKITSVRVKVDSAYYDGDINQTTNEIIIKNVPEGSKVNALNPIITLSNDRTIVTPGSGETVDMSDTFFGVDFTVSDYINKRVYNVRIEFITGLEEIYEDGEWVNIYDIRGQKIATTNDVTGLSLERGIYIVVGSKGSRKISVQ